jgi:flagellar biosynthesis protein FliR
VLMFVTDLHHLVLQSLADSYALFGAGAFPDIADFTEHATRTVNDSFLMALQLSAPHIVVGLVIYLAGGIIGKLMPTLQVFFILTAPNLMISFFVLMLVFSSLMTWYMEYFREHVLKFVGGT